MGHSSYPRSAVLVLGQSSIYSLLPSTLFAQVESLLRNGRLAEAQALLERAEADFAEGSTSSSDQETLRYLHQCLAFAFLRQTRFREATTHFVKGAIDPRVPVAYFDELRPALFTEPPSRVDGSASSRGGEGDSVEVEVWDGVREYMPDETSVDDIIATNLVRNYSPYLRPVAMPGSSAEDEPADAEPSTSDPHTKSGTRTHPATIAMRGVLREEATGMVKSILAAVLGSAEMWSRDVIETASTALALLYAHVGDIPSLLAVFAPPPSAPSNSSSRPVSRSSSRPPSRPGPTSHSYHSNGQQASITSLPSHTQHTPHPSQTISPNPPGPALPFCPGILAPVLSQMNLWGVLVEMWKVCGDGGKVVDILVGLTEGTYVDSSVVDPLGQIFSILAPTRTDLSTSTVGVSLSLSEHERSSLVKRWAAWLAGKDVERGLKLLISPSASRHRRPTGAAGRGRDKGDRERDAQRADELVILSELRNTHTLAAKRYLEWLVVGRGLGRGGKETTEEEELFEELVWNCVEEVLEYVADEAVGKLWRAKAASYASSPSASATAPSPSPPPPPPKSDSLPLPNQTSSQSSSRSSFLSYFASTTPDSPSKHARIKTLLLLQSIREGRKLVQDIQDRITESRWDKILGLEMAVLQSKIPSARTTLKTLYSLRDTSTAESFASSGGLTGVVSTKIGVSAAEGCGLSDWSGWFARGSGVAGVKDEKGPHNGDNMLKMLLEVYMEDGDMQQTARFLSSQAKRLDVVDIFPLVPTTWPLRALSTYLSRSLRRTQHTTHEGQIVKAICAGQNLTVLEGTFEVLQEEGAIVEEAVSDDEEGKQGEDGVGRSFDEKGVLRGRAEGGMLVVDVHVGDGER